MQFSVRNADIGFRNFKGEAGPYNDEGDRSFAIFLDEEMAENLLNDGWNVKFPKPIVLKEGEEDYRNPYLDVAVVFKNFPPKIIVKTGQNSSRLDEEEVGMLDWLETEEINVVVRPYQWTMNGKTGVKAYLNALYATTKTDEFAEEYGM